MTRVPELLAAGVPVAFGHDCVMDPWYSLGSGDMLEVAHMGLHVAQMTGQDAMRACFEAVTTTPAKILGLDDTGIAVGKRADLVLLQARDAVEALRLRATRLMVLRAGNGIATTPPATATLNLPGRPGQLGLAGGAGGHRIRQRPFGPHAVHAGEVAVDVRQPDLHGQQPRLVRARLGQIAVDLRQRVAGLRGDAARRR
ncbi:hypothetical protein G6F35_014136 [Rhizopus arrhizus]|nr:hypothetical protein G6F35_014136 [Rhizopus arrhizus]